MIEVHDEPGPGEQTGTTLRADPGAEMEDRPWHTPSPSPRAPERLKPVEALEASTCERVVSGQWSVVGGQWSVVSC
jgi:hypothetical protein